MSEPIVVISHQSVKEGKFDGYKELSKEVLPKIKESKPGTVAQLGFANEDNSMISFIHVFPSAEAFDHHLKDSADRSEKAYDYIDIESFEIYGTPSASALKAMKQSAASLGVELALKPNYFNGFMRLG